MGRKGTPPGRSPLAGKDKSIPALTTELKDMVVAYAKQETVEPIKNLGRFVAFGLLGSLLLAVGLLTAIVGVLRVLQEETGGTFDGTWSWAPYLITLVVCVLVIALAASAIGRAKRRRRK